MNKEEIKSDLQQMFWEPAIDYASNIVPITFETDEEVIEVQKEWERVHKAYTKGVNDAIDFIFANYDVKKLGEPQSIETPEDKELRIQSEIDYNNFCARATLYPDKSIEEVKHMQKMQRIKEAYDFINGVFMNGIMFNDVETRRWVIEKLQGRLKDCIAKCDEENNPPEIIDKNLLIAKVMWNSDYSKTWDVSYVDMIFGAPEQVTEYQKNLYLDNETFKFIEKGL